MGRFRAGLLLAMGSHILLFALPVYRPSPEPVPFPTTQTITLRFNALQPRPTPKKEVTALPPEPVIVPEQPVATLPPPKPEPKRSKPKPKVRKIVRGKKRAVKPPRSSPPAEPQKVQDKPVPKDPRSTPVKDATPIALPPKPVPTDDKAGLQSAVTFSPPPPILKAYPKNEGNPPPEYPPLARRRGLEGTVQLAVLVLENGRVGDISVAESSGHPLLDDAALKTVARYQFVPGRQGTKPVSMQVRVPVHFRLQGAQ